MKRILAVAVLGIMSFGTAYAETGAVNALKSAVSPATMEITAPEAVVEMALTPTARTNGVDGSQGARALAVLRSIQEDPRLKDNKGTFNIRSFHNRNFGSLDYNYVGYHVEVDGDLIMLTAILNPRFNQQWYRDHNYIIPSHTHIYRCVEKNCTGMKNPFEEELPSDGRHYVRLMDDGNFITVDYSGDMRKFLFQSIGLI